MHQAHASRRVQRVKNSLSKKVLTLWQLRARWTLLDVVQSISHTKSGYFSTCSIDSAIFYLFPIFSHFVILFIFSSSVLEKVGFSEIEGVISSKPTWQCLIFFFLHSFKFACLLKNTNLNQVNSDHRAMTAISASLRSHYRLLWCNHIVVSEESHFDGV